MSNDSQYTTSQPQAIKRTLFDLHEIVTIKYIKEAAENLYNSWYKSSTRARNSEIHDHGRREKQ